MFPGSWNNSRVLVVVFLAIITLPSGSGMQYPLRLQPELDVIDIESYLSNPRLLKLQIECILNDGPCDAVGRWAKPRVKAGLLGECLLCTEKQKGWLNTWLEKLIKEHPELYRAGIAKFLQNTGISISKDESDNASKTIASE